MESILIISLIVFTVLLIVAVLKVPSLQKYSKYAFVLIPGIIVLAYMIFCKKNPKSQKQDDSEFSAKVEEIKGNIEEITKIAEIKAQYTKEKNDEVLRKLDEVTKIEDQTVRRKALVDMFG